MTVSPCTQGSPFAFFNALNWSIVSLLLLEILFKHSTVLLESQHSLEKYKKSTMAQETLSSADTEGTEWERTRAAQAKANFVKNLIIAVALMVV